MLKKFSLLVLTCFLTIIFISIFSLNISAKSVTGQAIMDVNGSKISTNYCKIRNKIYFPLADITENLGMEIEWNRQEKCVDLKYTDGSYASIFIDNKKLRRESLNSPLDVVIKNGITYINKEDLKDVINYNYYWDEEKKILYTYLYAYYTQGKSLIHRDNNNDLHASGNSIIFDIDGLPKAEWQMNGELIDFRLINENNVLNIKEYKYVAFYQNGSNQLSQIVFTQRILPNDDQMILITGYAGDENQYYTQNISSVDNAYGSDFYLYKDKNPYHELVTIKDYSCNSEFVLEENESLDCWIVFGQETLELNDPYVLKAWELCESYYSTNEWINANGTNRGTPKGYKDTFTISDNNYNLQATTPALLLETYQVTKNRLLEDLIHNAVYTLIHNQDDDGFWHSGTSVAYLNKAYQLGSEYVDTRMSVDASLFLLRYGKIFSSEEAIECGTNFKKYFYLLQDKGLVYKKGAGTFYPDYYSSRHNGKTLVSLNHALYEMQYLYTIYNWFGDEEAKTIADGMLCFIENTADKWVSSKGDLYYAYNEEDRYYATDYINVTYVDLFTLKSILNYQNRESVAINYLYEQKRGYLQQVDSNSYESKLSVDYIYNNFDSKLKNKGDLFVSYPIEIVKSKDVELAYSAYGAYVFVKGAESVTHKGQTLNLDPRKKYFIILTENGVDIAKKD